ncbi:MAG TPA: tetratricopeptide repeat protein [Thermoanaerobaculia bacterium]|jgi:Flp pilus assembly protein TadD|nr:tetratricopeptide repeat protein [Thermoanaerobaculia bacterium]
MKKTLALLILSFGPLGVAVQAQASQASPAKPATAPAPAAPAKPPTELEKKVQEVTALVQAGKTAEALPRLQALEKDPAATPPVHALVGMLYVELGKPAEGLAVLRPLADAEDAQPAVLYQAGRAALALGKRDEAKVYFTRSVLKEPASPAARELGMLTAQDGRVVEAYSMLRPWALRKPSDRDGRLMAATLALTLERPDDAAELLTGQPDNDPAVRLLRGRVLVQKKDGPGAVALLQPLLANHPPGMDLEVRRNLAEAQMLAGKPAEAVSLLQGRAGTHPVLVLLLGRAQHQAGNAAAALATLKPLAEKIPDNPNTLGDPRPAAGIAEEYGTLLLDGGHAVEAVPFLDKGARFNPRNVDAWKTLARGLNAAGKPQEARAALAQADEAAKPPAPRSAAAAAATSAAAPSAAAGGAPAAAHPGAAAATAADAPLSPGLQNALRLMAEGQLDNALTAVRQEIGVSKDPRARLVEVKILLAQKKSEEALQSVQAALQTEPNNPDYVYLRGAVEMSLQRLSSAEQDLRKALQLSPRHTAAMNDLAVLLMSVNKRAEAKRLLEQVLKINPQDQMAAANLERLNTEAQQ